ncbi:MAG TPA: hypothetical protein VJ894_09225 [Cryomorphaceae bacterium]|nr:hypothetical protein [Cryomorphaceae bacterium]
MVAAYNYSVGKKRFGLLSSCLVVLLACSSLGSDDDPVANEFTSDFVSADLWLDNSRDLILQKNSEKVNHTLHAELPKDDLSFQIVLDQKNDVSQVNVRLTSSLSKILYFDYGRLAFSETKFDGETQLMTAYADGRAYAHALPDGGEPSAGQLTSALLNQQSIHSIISLAKGYSLKEKKATHNIRITENKMVLLDSVSIDKDFTAVVNVKQGEKMKINLTSNAPHIYFTLSPSIGSDMEYKFWAGPATFTGDLEIRVFAAEDIRDGSFKFDIESF